MLDLKEFENNFEKISLKLKRRGVNDTVLDNLRELFLQNREAKQQLEKFQALQNEKSKLFPQYKDYKICFVDVCNISFRSTFSLCFSF